MLMDQTTFLLLFVFDFAQRVAAVKDKVFIVEYNGYTVVWRPAAHFETNKAWRKLSYVLRKVLRKVSGDIDWNVLHIFYNKKKNTLGMNTNELNSETIEQFWNKLKDDKREQVMYFEICENLPAMDNDEKVGDNYRGINDKREYYFVVKYDNRTLNWSPNTLTNVDWSQQFEKLKDDVCSYFGLQVSAQMGFKFDAMGINNSEDIEIVWEEEVESGNTKSVELKVVNAIKVSDVNTNIFYCFFVFFAIVMLSALDGDLTWGSCLFCVRILFFCFFVFR